MNTVNLAGGLVTRLNEETVSKPKPTLKGLTEDGELMSFKYDGFGNQSIL